MPAPKGAQSRPSSTIPPPTVGTATRNSVKMPLPQNNIKLLPNAVNDYNSAEKFLAKNLLSLLDEPYTIAHHSICKTANEIARQLTDTLTPHIIDHVVRAIAPQMAKLLTTSDQLSDTLECAEAVRKALVNDRDEMDDSLQISADQIETAADELHTSVAECQNTIELLSPSLDTTQDCLNNLSTQLLSQSMPPSDDMNTVEPAFNHRQSYSSIVATNMPPSVDKAIE
ncbi:uncharacterized protein EDB93DRAFT_1107958 [Suillus bovinus]|uniref:uncharacterized protein n=1 Tax=Suillus bovinus TaxID=48563 RepID=UPI001B85EF56|nr:uncharacterized protein EDB93DRAFT_1107958 [Suillus bovinus]KAG2132121.1 hypothetical protein EDB93DRAFT_1107958 [Suillus bovinus]